MQVVNGWNNVTAYNGGVTVGLTSSLVKPKYTWNFNYYTGPENAGLPPQYAGTQQGYRNLFDTTLLLTPNAKFNAYVNYDYGQNRIPGYTYPTTTARSRTTIKSMDPHWQGIAASAREQITPNAALVFRYEYFYDNQGFATGLDYYSNDYLYQTTSSRRISRSAPQPMNTSGSRGCWFAWSTASTGPTRTSSTMATTTIMTFGTSGYKTSNYRRMGRRRTLRTLQPSA